MSDYKYKQDSDLEFLLNGATQTKEPVLTILSILLLAFGVFAACVFLGKMAEALPVFAVLGAAAAIWYFISGAFKPAEDKA